MITTVGQAVVTGLVKPTPQTTLFSGTGITHIILWILVSELCRHICWLEKHHCLLCLWTLELQ